MANVCEDCGCDDLSACGPGDRWVRPGLCSYCVGPQPELDLEGAPLPSAPAYRQRAIPRGVA